MQARFHLRRHAAAPLVLGLLLALAGCGGGGGGSAVSDGGSAGSTTTAGAASGSAGPASGSGAGAASSGGTTTTGSASTSSDSASTPSTPVAEVRYTLGPVTIANDTTVDFQNLEGMAATGDGGYRIVWSTATFDSAGAVQRAWFEQRFDAAGQRVGGETPIAAPAEDFSTSRAASVDALGGGSLQFGFTDALRPGLSIQQFAADGTPLDAPIELGGASHGWSFARLALPDGAVAICWQPVSSVGPGELQTALMVPGPR